MKKIAVYIILVCISCFIYAGYRNDKQTVFLTRLDDLTSIWSSARDLYGYWDQVGGTENWDCQFKEYKRQLWNCDSEYDYYLLLEKMVAELKDGHAMVLANFNRPSWVKELKIAQKMRPQPLSIGHLPIGLSYIEGKYIVTERTEDSPIPLYAEITQIEGKPTERFLDEEISDLVGVQTDGIRQQELANRFCRSESGKRIKVTCLTKEGEVFTEKLRYASNLSAAVEEIPRKVPVGTLLYDGEYMELYDMGDVCFLKIFTLDSGKVIEEFEADLYPHLVNFSRCVVDLRECGGGNIENGIGILSRLIKEPIRGITQRISLKSGLEMRLARQLEDYGDDNGGVEVQNTAILRGQEMLNGTYYYTLLSPDAYSDSMSKVIEQELLYDEDQETVKAVPPVFTKESCVFLIGSQTASAGEEMALQAQDAGITLIGSRTAGIVGDLVFECLSNGWLVGYSCGNNYGPGGEVIWNHGVVPDIEMQNTLDCIIEEGDDVLEFALNFIRKRST